MFSKTRHVHFVGIGGIGMSGIAEVLLNLGHRVSGSDLRASDVTRRLAGLGVRVYDKHDAQNIKDAHVVVVSSAVLADNPEAQAARALRIPVIPRAEMLAELMRLKLGVAVAGAHGKTSTTSMTAKILYDAGLDPTVVNGGRLGILGSSSRLGRGDVLVAEADESDRSFLMLSPIIAVATNLDEEHMESYTDMDDMAAAYERFLDSVPFHGTAIVNAEDDGLRAIATRLRRPVVRFGIDCDAEVVGRSLKVSGRGTRFTMERRGEVLGELELPVPGRYSVQNALAAAAVAFELDVAFDTVAQALAGFEAAERRFQTKGEARDVLVIDDYAHHPTEIAATLRALKLHHGRRVIAVFQPHRYSRVARLGARFAGCFSDADVVIATDIYPAGEEPRPDVSAEALAESIRAAGSSDVHYLGDLDGVPDAVVRLSRPGDVVITLGAGSVTLLGSRILERLGATS